MIFMIVMPKFKIMQKMIDTQAIIKDNHKATAIKEAYITTTTQDVLA